MRVSHHLPQTVQYGGPWHEGGGGGEGEILQHRVELA